MQSPNPARQFDPNADPLSPGNVEAMEDPLMEMAEGEEAMPPEGEILQALEELTAEDLELLAEAVRQKEAMEEEMREKLGQVLTKHRDEAIRFRSGSGIERQWAEDQAYYEGQDDNDKSLYYKGLTTDSPMIAKPKAVYRSKVFLNITRPYVETAAGKVIEVLCPSDMPMWSLEPTPVPSMPKEPTPLVMALAPEQPPQPPQVDPATGQQMPAPPPPPPPPNPLEEAMKLARRAAEGATTWIEDKLGLSHFPAQLRSLVDESSRLGTGVLRGPVPGMVTSAKTTIDPNTGEENTEVLQEIVPGSKTISVWNCFPDPACGDNIHNGQFFVEHDQMVEKQVRDLIGQPGYIQSALVSVLDEGPMQTSAGGLVAPPFESQDISARRYHVWYYYGFLKQADVMAMQCSCDPADEIKNVGVPVIVTMINNTPVKAHLNPNATGRFPHDFMCWQKVAGSPFGIGIARQIRPCQAILNSHVRAMMENAGLSSGPQIVVARGSVVPADGSWEITPRKVWILKADADVQDVTQAMSAFQIPSIQDELLKAIDFALKMAENVTGLPVLLQGQQGPNGVPETLGGMQILVANASSLLRRMARIFDDDVITPHIGGYYDWMMLYAEDSSIKGDFRIIAHGSGALVSRDVRNTFILQSVPQMMQNPAFGIDPTRLFKEIAKISGMTNPESIMFTKEEIQLMMQQPPPPDPKIQVATINADAKLQAAAMTNETAQLRVKRDTDRDSVYVGLETQRTQVSAAAKMAELQLRRELALLEYANKNQITLDKLKVQLAIESGRNDLQRELATLPTPDEIAATVRGENIEQNAAPQIATPAVEPPGRAPDGQAFVS